MPSRRIEIRAERDVLIAASAGANMAESIGLSNADCARVETTISELARNMVVHAHGGTLVLAIVSNGRRRGVQICATDAGAGIKDIGLALQDGFTTQNSLGIGLGVAKRMMDDFSIRSHLGWGTNIVAVKWDR